MYDVRAWCAFLLSLAIGTKPTAVSALNEEETLAAIADGKSIIRIGDGEVMLLTGRDVYFQPASPVLAKAFRMIIGNYNAQSPYLLGVPAEKITAPALSSAQHRVWRWFRIVFPLRFKTNERYVSAVYFYKQGRFKRELAPLFKKHHAVWLANEDTLSPALQSYAGSISVHTSFITAPGNDAFSAYDTIKSEVLAVTETHPQLPVVVCTAIGPAGKVLAYELATQGIQVLDLGHGMSIIANDDDRLWRY